jgi:hypothetical protein
MPDANQVQQVLNDPNFYSLPVSERTKALSRLDDNFAALPPDEQTKVVSRGIQSTPPATMPDLPGGTERLTNAVRTGQAPSSLATPTQFEKENATPGVFDWLSNKAATFNTSASGAPTLPALWSSVKAGARKVLNEGPISAATDFVQDQLDNQSDAVAKYPTNDSRRYLAAVPGVGPRLADAGTSWKQGDVAGAAANLAGLGAGAKIAAEVPARVSKATAYATDAATNPARTYANVRDALHPAPDVPPGLSPDATANLANKTARLGTEDLFRASGPAGSNPAFRERLSIAAPDIAEIQRQTPLQTSGGFVNPDFRVREFVTNADAHLDNLWNQERMPQIQRNANAVRSLDPVKQSILSSVSDLDRENYPGAVQEINRRIMSMPDTENLSQINDRLREVNAQRNAYRGMTAQERAAANITSPKMDALNAEHQALQQTISDELANRGEAGIRDFDRRYGALSEVRDTLRDQMNSTEATRLLDQVRGWISPTGAIGMHERLPLTPSRGRTLETGLQRLARSPLQTPSTPAPNPPRIAGQLPPPPPILAPPPDTSGPVPANERTAPVTWTAGDIDRVARQTPQAPPPVMPQFAKEGTGTVQPIALGPGTGGPTYRGPYRPPSMQAHPALPGPGPSTMPPVPQSSTAPPTLPPLPTPAPINPQELADFTRTLRGMGYQGPITADNINELLRQANAIRSSMAVRRGVTE